MPLRLLDKLKSLLIYYSNSYCNGDENRLDDEINNTFGEIFKIFLAISKHQYISNIGNTQFGEDDIFRYHAGSNKFENIDFLGHYRSSSSDTYDKLKDELKELCKKCQDKESYSTLEGFIRSYTKDLKDFYQAFLDLLDNIDSNPSVFKMFMFEKVNPYFYNSLVRLKINNDLDDDLIKLICKADILFFKSGSSCDATAYNLIYKYLKSKDEFKQAVIQECKKSKNAKKVINGFKYDAYQLNSFHYVFFEQNCSKASIDTLKGLIKNKEITQEKEHIIPLNIWEEEDEVSAKKYGFKDLDDLESLIDSYGNLLSLEKSLNSKAKDKDLYGKKDIYTDSKIAFIRQFDITNFNKDKIIKRNDELEKWMKEEFFKEFL